METKNIVSKNIVSKNIVDQNFQDTEKVLAHYAEKRRLSEQVDNSNTIILSLSRNSRTTKFEVSNELLDKLAKKIAGEE